MRPTDREPRRRVPRRAAAETGDHRAMRRAMLARVLSYSKCVVEHRGAGDAIVIVNERSSRRLYRAEQRSNSLGVARGRSHHDAACLVDGSSESTDASFDLPIVVLCYNATS
jgi:hypothetical protein